MPSTSSGNSSTAFAVNITDDEMEFLLGFVFGELFGLKTASSAFHQGAVFFGPFSVWDIRETVSNGTPGNRISFDVQKYSDGLMGIGLVCDAPMVVDANTTGYVKSVSSSGTLRVRALANDILTRPTIAVASVGGTNAALSLSMVPASGALLGVATPFSAAVNSLFTFSYAGGGVITYIATEQVNAAITAEPVGRLVSYLGDASSFSGMVKVLINHAGDSSDNHVAVPGTGVSTCYAAFKNEWVVTTPGSRITSTEAAKTLSGHTNWKTVPGDVDLTATNAGVTIALEEGIDVHNAYYVNGLCCSAISAFTMQQGGMSTLYSEVSGAALRRLERAIRNPNEWCQGVTSNFGTQAELARYAHRLPYISGSTTVAKQRFSYSLPIFNSTSDAIWLNAHRGGTANIKIQLADVKQLVVASTTPATATEATLPHTRFQNHADSGTPLQSSDLVFSLQLVYYQLTSAERKFFQELSTVRHLQGLSPTQSEAFAAGVHASQIAYQHNKLATLMIVSGQCDHETRPVTNGKFDQHTYLRNLKASDGPTQSSDTVVHIPVIDSVDELFQGNKRCTLDSVTSQMYAGFMRGGQKALDTGSMYMPYDLISHTEGRRGVYTGFNPNSSIDRHMFAVHLAPGNPRATVFLEHAHTIFTSYANGSVSQVFI